MSFNSTFTHKDLESDNSRDLILNSHASERPENLERGLSPRQTQMIAVGGIIGSGYFIGTGAALATGGPVGLLLGYAIMGLVTYSVIVTLGEMTSLYPVSGGFVYLANRFVDPALGFAQGWNYCYGQAITVPAEITAGAIVISYWNTNTNAGVWITMFLVAIIGTNFAGIRYYGEVEFWMSAIKILAIVGLLILGIVIDLGGAPSHDRLGFRYWIDPGPFSQLNDIPGALGRFLAFWSVFVNAAFSYGGVEVIALTAAESANPHRTIPRAVRTVFWRILIFYVGGVFVMGLTVPFTNEDLLNGSGTATASPFVIAIATAGINTLPSIINSVILLSTFSAGNCYLYAASRTLYGLALDGQAPKVLSRVSRSGLPYYAVGAVSLFGFLAYLNLSTEGATVFSWLATLSAITTILTWIAILITYLRFRAGKFSTPVKLLDKITDSLLFSIIGVAFQGINRAAFPYQAPFQPYLTWFGLTFLILICLCNGFQMFLSSSEPFATSDFFASYSAIPLYLAFFTFWKFYSKTTFVSLHAMDFSGTTEACEAGAREENVESAKEDLSILGRAGTFVSSAWQ